MSKVKIQGHASGTGVLTVTAPNTSTDRTITLPDGTGTLLTTDGDGSSLTGVGGDLSFGGDTFGADKTIGANDAYALSFETNGNEAMKIDSDGHITKPLQSAFLANNNSNQTLSDGTVLRFATERFDQNGDFDNSTWIFTAPITGKYFFGGMLRVDDISNSGSYIRMYLRTSNADYAWIIDQEVWDQTSAYTPIAVSLLVDMDAGDTCKLVWQVGSGGGTPHLDGGINSSFSGHLVCQAK